MNTDTKHNNVMVAINMMRKAISELRMVVDADGPRGQDMVSTVQLIEDLVNNTDDISYRGYSLSDWLEWLEMDLDSGK